MKGVNNMGNYSKYTVNGDINAGDFVQVSISTDKDTTLIFGFLSSIYSIITNENIHNYYNIRIHDDNVLLLDENDISDIKLVRLQDNRKTIVSNIFKEHEINIDTECGFNDIINVVSESWDVFTDDQKEKLLEILYDEEQLLNLINQIRK